MLFQSAVRSSSRFTLPRALGLATSRHFGTSTAVSFQRSSLILNNEENKNEADKNKWQQQTIANEFIEAVLYGSKKTKEEDNMTHSKTLARGKYVHELQSTLRWRGLYLDTYNFIYTEHKVKPDKVQEYIQLV